MIGFGGDPGFDVTFSIMRIMVPVMFVLVFGIIIVTIIIIHRSCPFLPRWYPGVPLFLTTIITREMGCIIPIPLPAITPPFR